MRCADQPLDLIALLGPKSFPNLKVLRINYDMYNKSDGGRVTHVARSLQFDHILTTLKLGSQSQIAHVADLFLRTQTLRAMGSVSEVLRTIPEIYERLRATEMRRGRLEWDIWRGGSTASVPLEQELEDAGLVTAPPEPLLEAVAVAWYGQTEWSTWYLYSK